ncbi:hypothetical protein T484DRAFT_1886360 [Baffinella frigidus]|nr:hypothetical protein T484DRAFT_1886360 [Cryptophyta sp. CCMP2293]
MCSAPPPLPATSDAATDGRCPDSVTSNAPVPLTPEAPRSQAQQDNAGGSGVVEAVTPRRGRNAPKVELTRELLESHYHEPLDTVAERLGLSKTTIKAACRSLGLAKWPYQHTGSRKRRMGVPKSEQDADSEHARTLKATFHELMSNTDNPPSAEQVSLKRQRVGEAQMAPTTALGAPLSLLPATLPYLQPMHLQSDPALSAMGSASDQQLALHAAVQGQAFSGQAPPPWTPAPLLQGGNLAGTYSGNFMPEGAGGGVRCEVAHGDGLSPAVL